MRAPFGVPSPDLCKFSRSERPSRHGTYCAAPPYARHTPAQPPHAVQACALVWHLNTPKKLISGKTRIRKFSSKYFTKFNVDVESRVKYVTEISLNLARKIYFRPDETGFDFFEKFIVFVSEGKLASSRNGELNLV